MHTHTYIYMASVGESRDIEVNIYLTLNDQIYHSKIHISHIVYGQVWYNYHYI